MMRKLPSKEKEMMEMDERRLQRLDLHEIKQNIWRKWRGKKEKTEGTEDEKIERQTIQIEKILQKISEDKKLEEKKKNEWAVRRIKLLEDGRKAQEEK